MVMDSRDEPNVGEFARLCASFQLMNEIVQLALTRDSERVRAVVAALSATPAEAMERGVAEDSPDLNKVAWQALDDALAKLYTPKA